MKRTRLILTLALIALAAAGTWYFARSPVKPIKMQVAEGAAILYYNNPAAIQVHDRVHIGYVTATGLIEVASVDLDAKTIIRRIPIHDYGKPDDHAAPALWPEGEGILVATAFHSSGLFLYRINSEGVAALACHWPGMFSYPRFAMAEDGLRLYVRSDPDGAGSIALFKGPQSCSQEEILFRASTDEWLYSTVPDANRIAWSVWNRQTGKHTDAFIDGTEISLAPSPYDETLMWSLAGTYYAATRFRAAFECCMVGEMVAELYNGDALIFATPPMPSPYYPTGIVLSTTAQEALIPTPEHGIERRSLPDLTAMPTCEQSSPLNTRGQYILGGDGSYIWLEFTPPIAGREYEAGIIALCLL